MKKKVLFLTPWYPHREDPMFGLFVRKQAAALTEKADVAVIAVISSNLGENYELVTEIFDQKLPEIRVYFMRTNFGFLNVIRTHIAYKKGLKYFLKKYGTPDVIHANIFTRTAVSACIFAKRLKIPFVVSEHWSRYYPENFGYRGFLRKMLTNRAARKAKALIVPSSQLQHHMKECGIKGHYKIVPNVIDHKLFEITRTENQDGKKHIVHVSCFEDKSKNISGLIKAVSELRKNRDDFILDLVGTGDDLEKIRNLVKELNMEHCVQFHGMLENQSLAEIVKRATCSVLSSHYETFAIVVYESLACGVPVVVTNVAGLGRLISPEFGISVKTGDIQEMTAALNTILNTAEKFKPESLRAYILNGYTPEAVAGKLLAIYTK